jgi:hypothetical protein
MHRGRLRNGVVKTAWGEAVKGSTCAQSWISNAVRPQIAIVASIGNPMPRAIGFVCDAGALGMASDGIHLVSSERSRRSGGGMNGQANDSTSGQHTSHLDRIRNIRSSFTGSPLAQLPSSRRSSRSVWPRHPIPALPPRIPPHPPKAPDRRVAEVAAAVSRLHIKGHGLGPSSIQLSARRLRSP